MVVQETGAPRGRAGILVLALAVAGCEYKPDATTVCIDDCVAKGGKRLDCIPGCKTDEEKAEDEAAIAEKQAEREACKKACLEWLVAKGVLPGSDEQAWVDDCEISCIGARGKFDPQKLKQQIDSKVEAERAAEVKRILGK